MNLKRRRDGMRVPIWANVVKNDCLSKTSAIAVKIKPELKIRIRAIEIFTVSGGTFVVANTLYIR